MKIDKQIAFQKVNGAEKVPQEQIDSNVLCNISKETLNEMTTDIPEPNLRKIEAVAWFV